MNNFSISRVFDAPRSLVFDCWVVPAHFEKWGLLPADCMPTLRHADVRPGGYYLIEQHGPDGAHIFAKFAFREIDPNNRLVFVTTLCDESGETVSNPAVSDWPLRLLTTVVFEDAEQGTRVSVEWDPLDATPAEIESFQKNMHMGHEGWSQTFDRLTEVLHNLRAPGENQA